MGFSTLQVSPYLLGHFHEIAEKRDPIKIRLIIFSRLLKNEVALSHADNANIYFINGVLSQDESKLKEAISFFEEYFKYGNNLEAYVRIVKALEDIGDKEKYYKLVS